MSKMVKLPSGVIFDADRLMFVGSDTKAIGKYGLVLENCPLIPTVDGTDLDALIDAGIITVLYERPKIASANRPKGFFPLRHATPAWATKLNSPDSPGPTLPPASTATAYSMRRVSALEMSSRVPDLPSLPRQRFFPSWPFLIS